MNLTAADRTALRHAMKVLLHERNVVLALAKNSRTDRTDEIDRHQAAIDVLERLLAGDA